MKLAIQIAGICLCTAASVAAQTQSVPQVAPLTMTQQPIPLQISPPQPVATAVLPANTVVTLSMNDTITTKGKRWGEGDNFDMTVTQNVYLGQYIVIPRGARGSGRITFMTNKGAFGKSGKFEFDIEYAEVSGRRIPLSGHYRQEGEGNTVGTVAGVVVAGVLAGFVTGKSGVVPAGRELTARTKEDLPVAFAAPPQQIPTYQVQAPQIQAPQPAPLDVNPAPIVAQPARSTSKTQPNNPAQRFGNSRIRCDTCR